MKKMNKEELLDAVKLTGEGRGRLTLGQAQYVFGVDSVLNENRDWIMAVQIPLHGEEVMILPDLTKRSIKNEEMESFEERIENEFRRLEIRKIMTGEEFLQEMRSVIRFVLTKEWGGKRDCAPQDEDFICQLDGENFLISTRDKEFIIKKSLKKGVSLEIVARNLTKPFFQRTDILLYSQDKSAFSMELFW